LIAAAPLDHDGHAVGSYPDGTLSVLGTVTSFPPDRNGKAALRTQILSCRDQIAEEIRQVASAAIAAHAEAVMRALAPRSTIAVYAAKGSEVDVGEIDAMARRLGHEVAYPRVVAGQPWLAFHFAEAAALRAASFGLREPAAGAPRAELSAIACFFVPGIAFDHLGGRVGWGRGYYDNTFARAAQATRIGVAFECQVVDRVPVVEHDILLHGLLTEARVRRFGT
jgi:5-formyltetrahydrofolate cyclo-ligase